MKTKVATLSLLLLCSLAASAQLNSLTIGRLTYIGENPNGNSAFTVKLKPSNLAAPIAFKAINQVEVGAAGSNGPKPTSVSYSTPTELLFFAAAPPNGFNWVLIYLTDYKMEEAVTEQKVIGNQAVVVERRKEGIFTIATWSDGQKTFSVPSDKVQAASLLITEASGIWSTKSDGGA
jgi:hypothetical protein